MDPVEALRQAEAHLKNATELVGRPVGKEELMYMWDNQITALAGVSLEIPQGAFAAVMGQSGSGKSTLLHLIGGLDRPSSGELLVDDRLIGQMSDDLVTLFRRRRIGFIFQFFRCIFIFLFFGHRYVINLFGLISPRLYVSIFYRGGTETQRKALHISVIRTNLDRSR